MKWIRPYIILFFVLIIVVGFFMKLVDPQAFWVFATGLVVWWFKSRDETKNKDIKP